jgi:hypothetical protein
MQKVIDKNEILINNEVLENLKTCIQNVIALEKEEEFLDDEAKVLLSKIC